MKQTLEERFTAELLTACRRAQEQFGCPMAGLIKRVETYGGVPTARDYFRKNRLSDGFEVLRQQEQLALSMEALATQGRYGTLFTDQEVNACFQALCEAGYYTSLQPPRKETH